MFSLIVTLISIALVAALALATLYYGGPVFNQGAARVHAAKIAAQGQQLQGAAELYKADNGEYPVSLAELVAKDYLKSIPVAAAQEQVLISNAHAAATWVMVAGKIPVFALVGVSESVCKAVNLGSYGVDGILKTARETNRVQCYGTDVNNLMIIQAKAPADLVAASTHPAAVIQIGVVTPAPIPAADSTDTSNDGWLVPPGEGTPVVAPPAAVSLQYLSSNNTVITSLDLGAALVAEPSPSKTIKVKNNGTLSANFAAEAVSVPPPYAVTSTTCSGAVLAPGAECEVTVSFTPTATQYYGGDSFKLSLATSNASPPALPVFGTSMPIKVSVSEAGMPAPFGYDYSSQGGIFFNSVMGEAVSKTIVLKNISNYPGSVYPQLNGDYLQGSWNARYDFDLKILSTTCGVTLLPGETCSVNLGFSSDEPSPSSSSTQDYQYSYLIVQSGLHTGIAPPSSRPSPWNWLNNEGYDPVLRINHKVTEPVNSYEITIGSPYLKYPGVSATSYARQVSIRNTTSSYNVLVAGQWYDRIAVLGIDYDSDRERSFHNYAYAQDISGHDTDTFITTIEGSSPSLVPDTANFYLFQPYNRLLGPWYGDFMRLTLPPTNAVPAVWCATGTQTQLEDSRPTPPTVVVGPCP